jgi:hypothetical protein
MTPQTQHIVNQIKERIDNTRRALNRKELFTGGLKTFSVIVLLGTIFVLIESIAEFDSQSRMILFYLCNSFYSNLHLADVASIAEVLGYSQGTFRSGNSTNDRCKV